MTRVRGGHGGIITVTVSDDEFIALTRLEADLLGTLADRLRAVADGAVDPHPLFPDAYRDDADAASEFHALTDVDLVTAKSDGARSVMTAFVGAEQGESGSFWRPAAYRTATLDTELAHAFLRNLTDLRLMIANRLGIERDDDQGFDGDDYAVDRARYWWLGETQEGLVEALAADAFGH